VPLLVTAVHDHDLAVAEPDGWRLRKSVYRKLRLGLDAMTTRLERPVAGAARSDSHHDPTFRRGKLRTADLDIQF
jgi:hypothetical protein